MIEFACPTCGHTFAVGDDRAGQIAACGKCGQRIHIPPPVRQRPIRAAASAADRSDVGTIPAALPMVATPRQRKASDEKFCCECGTIIRAKAIVCPACGVPQPTDSGFDLAHNARPGKATAIGIMILVSGVLSLLGAFILSASVIGLFWPGSYFEFFLGVWSIVVGCMLLGGSQGTHKRPMGTSIMLVVNIINGNLATAIMGIICLVFLSDPDVRRYYRHGDEYA